MKVWKRCLAAVLSFILFCTSANISEAAGTFDDRLWIWKSTDAEIVAEFYGLDEKESAALLNDAVNGGKNYLLSAPYSNETAGKRNLLAVDYLNRIVYADAINTKGCIWMPVSADIVVDGEVKESITLTAGTCYFDGKEYSASQAFIYDGNKYTVEVTYELNISISTEEQSRLLKIPYVFAQTARNMEKNLRTSRATLQQVGEMIPYLMQLLDIEFEVQEMVAISTIEEQTDSIIINPDETSDTVTRTLVTKKVPALDPVEHSEEIAAIKALNAEYTSNDNSLKMYKLAEEYVETNYEALGYAMEKGETILDESAALYEQIEVLRNSSRLKTVINKLSTENLELYSQLQYLMTNLKKLIGTVRNPGPLAVLKNQDNWLILDQDLQASVFADGYSDEDFVAAEMAAYALRNADIDIYSVSSDNIPAAKRIVSCDITTYDVTVTISGEVVSGEVNDYSRIAMEPTVATFTLLEGATQEELENVIKESGIEKNTLAEWNAINEEYQITTVNYERAESELSGELYNDINDYKIVYTPKEYKVESNFLSISTLGYGSKLEFPVSNDEETSYEYIVETEDGSTKSYDEGAIFKITRSVKITRSEGSEKSEYRLYDFLANDVQYSMSEGVKSVLGSTAVNSPTIKIRVPDSSLVGDVVYNDGVYSIQASSFGAGIIGMTWIPNVAVIMKGEITVEEVKFTDDTASWTNGDFTHVNVNYILKIDKVKGDLFNRDLEETEVLEALNLPHNMVKHTVDDNELLCGKSDVTVKSVYEDLENLMYQLENGSISMTLKEALGLISGITGEEADEKIRLVLYSESRGGGWNNTADELALYTYLKQCEAANWSLAVYYQQGYWAKIKTQSRILAECLSAITNDAGFKADTVIPASYKQLLANVIPQLEEIANGIKGPHSALNMNDPDFASLLNRLLELNGSTTAIENSNGIYAHTSIRKNGENAGSLTVTVNLDSKLPKTYILTYELEAQGENGKCHVLTEAESVQLQEALKNLKASLGLTEEELQYYDQEPKSIKLPKAGEVLGKNASVTFNYFPKEYTVTIAGVDTSEYLASFKYKSDYVIFLPPYSEDAEYEDSYYLYTVNGEVRKSDNGLGSYYDFKKEDLTTLFGEQQHYEIERTEVLKDTLFVEVAVDENEEKIRHCYTDWANRELYLDADPNGLKVEEFEAAVTFAAGENAQIISAEVVNENRKPTLNKYLSNGSYVDLVIIDENKETRHEKCDIILLGDVNKDGKVNEEDRQRVVDAFFERTPYADWMEEYAADMNMNGNYSDSNDIWKIYQKYTYWKSNTDKQYVGGI